MYFQNFQQLVQEERAEFAQFASSALSELPCPAPLSPEYRKYATEHRAARIQRALQLPRSWQKVRRHSKYNFVGAVNSILENGREKKKKKCTKNG